MSYTVTPTCLPEVLILEPKVFGDERGFFFESFNQRDFELATGLQEQFVQDNHSKSVQGVLRGLHYQIQHPQGKLVRVVQGEVFDVAVDLRRSSPHFGQWAACGKALMELHIGYETVAPFGLTITDIAAPEKKKKATDAQLMEMEFMQDKQPLLPPKPKLKADKANGTIQIDEATLLEGIPPEACDYKLGNRSALEWVLDQYKEKKPTDPTILEKFNTYQFADYKETVIDLLQRVCTVSVETQKIIAQFIN